MNIQQTLDQLVHRAGDLYTLPAVAVEVLELTCRPEVDARALKASIERDPALASKVLRIVNSSLFGLGQPVRDLGQALALLGIKPLKLLVLGFSLPEGLFANVAGGVLSHYWRRTLTKAVASRELSESIWRLGGDEAFLVGLLQDLGELVLIQEIGQPYVEFLATVTQRQGHLAKLETEILGFDHTQLTARLLDHWRLPESLVQGCQLPSTSDDLLTPGSPGSDLSHVAYLAELIARLLVDQCPTALDDLRIAGRRLRHDLPREVLDELAATIQDKVAQLADVLALDLPEQIDYREVLRRAHRELVAAAAEAASDMVRGRSSGTRNADGELSMLAEMQALSSAVARLSASRAPATTAATEAAVAIAPPAPERPKTSRAAPKTGEAAVLAQLTQAAATCRMARCPLSLLLVEIDHYQDLAFARGMETAAGWLASLARLCQGVDSPGAVCLEAREACFALVLPEADRRTAVELGTAIARTVRDFAEESDGQRPTVTVSVGAATVAAIAKNFAPADLLEKADRCLYGAQAAGGDSLKSIEIY